uniref:Uncharacterized protein n=1 Tax=Rhizophora mucronata TaxID=61149 RepID=A0A2P2PUU7_RHIMU
MDPVNLLWERSKLSKLTRLPKVVGIPPIKRLWDKFKERSCLNSLSWIGIGPVNLLTERSIPLIKVSGIPW